MKGKKGKGEQKGGKGPDNKGEGGKSKTKEKEKEEERNKERKEVAKVADQRVLMAKTDQTRILATRTPKAKAFVCFILRDCADVDRSVRIGMKVQRHWELRRLPSRRHRCQLLRQKPQWHYARRLELQVSSSQVLTPFNWNGHLIAEQG